MKRWTDIYLSAFLQYDICIFILARPDVSDAQGSLVKSGTCECKSEKKLHQRQGKITAAWSSIQFHAAWDLNQPWVVSEFISIVWNMAAFLLWGASTLPGRVQPA